MICTFIPHCSRPAGGKDLGIAYNECMDRIRDDDWGCFFDHDAMVTTGIWYLQLEEIVAANPDMGILTCVTNRVGNEEQLVFPKDSPEALNHDIHFHRKIGMDMFRMNSNQVREAVNLISGVMILTSKRVWSKVGGFKSGFLGVDNDFDSKTRKAGYRTLIADGLYVYHWYRAAPSGGLMPCGYKEQTFLPPIE